MITLAVALALLAPNPATIDGPRRAFASCLKGFESKNLAQKIDAAAYETMVKTACQAEASGLLDALVRYDVAMGTKRAAATANAERDLDDYRATSSDRYRDIVTNQ